MLRILVRACFVLILLDLTCFRVHAKLRIYTNVDTASFSPELRANLAHHPWEKGFLDVTQAPYGALGDGVHDDTEAIQLAIDQAYAFNLVAFFPHGTYLVSKQLECYQDPGPQLPNNPISSASQRKFGHILQGSAKEDRWPVIQLKDRSDVKDNTLFVFKYYNSETGIEEASRHYLGSLRNFELRMGDNPGVSAVYNCGAQHAVLQNLKISGDFNVGISSLPGSGGYTANIEIIGGRIGILQDQFRPNPTLFGIRLVGQKECGLKVLNTRGSLTMAGFNIVGPTSPSSSYRAVYVMNTSTSLEHGAQANLNLVDGSIEVKGDVPSIYNFKQDVVIRNVWFKAASLIESGAYKTNADIVEGYGAQWILLSEYIYATAVDRGSIIVDGLDQRTGTGDYSSHFPLLVGNPPADLLTRHLWDSIPTWEDRNMVDLVLDYRATSDMDSDDDALALQDAIDDVSDPASDHFGKTLFIPRGHFHIKSPVLIKDGVRMIGAAKNLSVIQVSDSWIPSGTVSAISTEDVGGKGIVISDLAFVMNEANISSGMSALKHMTLFELKTGNSVIRDLQTDKRITKWDDNAYLEAPVKLSGEAGGKFFGLCLDYGTRGPADIGYHILECNGTPGPCTFYQLSLEDASEELDTEQTVHMKVVDCEELSIFGFKYEKESELLHVNNSESISIIGGSGNYGIKDPEDLSIITFSDVRNIYIANISRKKQSGEIPGKSMISDDGRLVTADAPVVLYKKKEDLTLYPIQFQVFEKGLDLPVAGVNILMGDTALMTGIDGLASIELLRGQYCYHVLEPYFGEQSASFFHHRDTVIRVEILRMLADVEFRVIHDKDEQGMEGAMVQLGDSLHLTDGLGYTGFEGIEVNTLHDYWVCSDGFGEVSDRFSMMQDTAIVIRLSPVSHTGSSIAHDIIVSPNPNQGKFKLELGPDISGDLIITIYDSSARIIAKHSRLVANNGFVEITLARQESGIFFLSVRGMGERDRILRFIIQ